MNRAQQRYSIVQREDYIRINDQYTLPMKGNNFCFMCHNTYVSPNTHNVRKHKLFVYNVLARVLQTPQYSHLFVILMHDFRSKELFVLEKAAIPSVQGKKLAKRLIMKERRVHDNDYTCALVRPSRKRIIIQLPGVTACQRNACSGEYILYRVIRARAFNYAA